MRNAMRAKRAAPAREEIEFAVAVLIGEAEA